MFHVGQKVVCVNDGKLFGPIFYEVGGKKLLVKGHIYTVQEVGIWAWQTEDFSGIRLVEITRHCHTPYHASRFRPLTNIDCFTRLLKAAPADREREPA